jgi:hypothetical protein
MLENQANVQTEQTPVANQVAVEQLYKYIIEQLKQGNNRYQIKEDLEKQGHHPETISRLVDHAFEAHESTKSEGGSKDMLYGALWCIGGIIVTAVTYSAASGGGRYFVAWGAIIFGGIQFFKGLANSMNS